MQKTEIELLQNVIKSGEFEKWCDEAIVEVFDGLFQASPKFSKEIPNKNQIFEISGVVAFITDDVEAVLQLSCSKQTLLNLPANLESEHSSDDKSIMAIGEATNIIFGYLKEKLNSYNLYYEKCLPIVIYGQNHIVLNLNKSVSFDQVYKTSYGIFNLKIGISQKVALTKAS